MAFLRVQVSIPTDASIPEDASVNVWHWRTAGAAATDAPDVHSILATFYAAIDANVYAASIGGPTVFKYYDLEDPAPRVPVLEDTETFSPDTQSYPSEVAICLSFRGALVSGQPVARRRGRVFLGPVSPTTAQAITGGVQVSASTRTTIATAAGGMIGSLPLPEWSVFSPTTAGPEPWTATELGNAFVPVVGGWIDDAYDTQRRRGRAPGTRTTFGT